MSEISLTTAAAELSIKPADLTRLALRHDLECCLLQPGWRWNACYLGGADAPTLVPADSSFLDLAGAPSLRPGPVPLLREHLYQLQLEGRAFVSEIEDPESELRVRLVEPRSITWDSVLVAADDWAAFRASPAASELSQVATPSTTASDGTASDKRAPTEFSSNILSENAAVERLKGMGKAAARRWLRREGLSAETAPAGDGGRKRPARLVIWSDVEDRLRQPAPAAKPTTGPKRQRQPSTIFGVVPGRLDGTSVSRKKE